MALLSATLMTKMQARQLKYNFELLKCGLTPTEFQGSLTKKVDGLLESTGLDRREPFIKEIIRKVKIEVSRLQRANNLNYLNNKFIDILI